MLCSRIKKLLLITLISVSGTGCGVTTAYKFDPNQPQATLSVRSPAGKPVSATIFSYDSECKATRKKLIADQRDTKALKTFSVPAGGFQHFIFEMRGGVFHDYSCFSPVVFEVESNAHYLINILAAPKKGICKNRLVNYQNKDEIVSVWQIAPETKDKSKDRYPTEAIALKVEDTKMKCEKLIQASMIGANEFKSTLMLNSTTYSVYGPIYSSYDVDEK